MVVQFPSRLHLKTSFMQPFEFSVGEPVSSVGVKKINDSANGLFSGQSGVKPPPALSTAVIGMKTGGKVFYGPLNTFSCSLLMLDVWSSALCPHDVICNHQLFSDSASSAER